ncbi:MAG: hypothetical protein ACPGQD_03725 [Planctomycetota bacterium]
MKFLQKFKGVEKSGPDWRSMAFDEVLEKLYELGFDVSCHSHTGCSENWHCRVKFGRGGMNFEATKWASSPRRALEGCLEQIEGMVRS